jgi:hypothetical protein
MRSVLLAALVTGCAAVAPVDAADPRFEACAGAVDTVDTTVAFTARDYREHFPLMGEAPELDTDDPAFAVVFADGAEVPIPLQPRLRGEDDPPPQPPDGNHRTVCVYVGMPPEGDVNWYVDVDVALLLP